jgi:hypothetical protein
MEFDGLIQFNPDFVLGGAKLGKKMARESDFEKRRWS